MATSGPPTKTPGELPPGPGSTGKIFTPPTPIGPPETAPPAVDPESDPGVVTETGPAATIPLVTEQPVTITFSSTTTNNIIPTVTVAFVKTLLDNAVVVEKTTSLNFSGNGVTVTGNGSQANIVITAGSGGNYGNANVAANLAVFGTNPITTSGNITAGYFFGNGSQLTGVAANYGNANVAANLASFANNPISTTGNVSGGNLFSSGFVSAVGNLIGGNVLASGLISAAGNITSATNLNTVNAFITGLVSVTGNITGGNINTGSVTLTATTLSAAGNITGGNILTAGIVSATGNVTGSFFVGNGSALTGIAANYGNANVAANLAAFGSNPILTTGNVTAGNFVGGGAGTPTVSSATNLDLSAVSAVRVIGGGTFRLPSLTTAQIANTIAANGDMIYNSSVNKFQGYENGAWANII